MDGTEDLTEGGVDRLRMTYATAVVVQALDRGFRHGFDIAEATGLRGGTVYPILRRLQDASMAKAHWEAVTIAREEGRPPRKYYELTPKADEFLLEARQRFPLTIRAGAAVQKLT